MRFSVLGSGSRGNAVYIESKKTGILIDAGFSGKEIERRLQAIGRDLSNVHGLCITHEHNDHIQGAGVISRRCKIPIYVNIGTLSTGEKRIGNPFIFKEFETGGTLEIGDLQIRSFRVSHDTADPVGFVVGNGKSSIGYCTDTGKGTHLIKKRLTGCNGLILEFNHDLEMLQNGPYPLPLQQRVRSNQGHLSNEDAALFLSQILEDRLRMVVLAHLSEINNTPDLAHKAVVQSVPRSWDGSLLVARQDTATPLIDL